MGKIPKSSAHGHDGAGKHILLPRHSRLHVNLARRCNFLAVAGDDIDVDLTAAFDQFINDRPPNAPLPPDLRRLPHDDLRNVALSSEVDERLSDVAADERVS